MVTIVVKGAFYFAFLYSVSSLDLTLVAESSGTSVVQACIAKMDEASIFSSDEQLLRRIAYVETHDGNDSDTYTGSNNNGGIWQLSSAKYSATKTGVSSSLLQSVSSKFGITWSSTSWSDLRKPFYSAIAARLYLEVISASIPLSTNISGQASYWTSYYTSSGGSASEFVTAVSYLNSSDRCEVRGLDIIFVMDASGSIHSSNFQTMKTFVHDIVNSFDIGLDRVRVGVMSYGYSYTFHFYLNTYSSKSSVLSAINSLPYSGGGTDTAGALNAVRTIGFTTSYGARPISSGIPRIAIVITDGKSNSYSATVSAANSMHNAGIIGFAIGIAGANLNELNAIASKSEYADFISSFDSNLLSNLQVSLSQEACVASTDLSVSEVVTDTLTSGETKYVNYPIPANVSGITVQLEVTNGSCTLYASTVVQTPNEALYDIMFSTDNGWEDAYIDHDDLSNPDTDDKVYIAIETGSVSSSIILSMTIGDNTTEPVSVTVSQSVVSDYYGATVSVHCFATGKPQPTVNWYKDGSLLSSSGQISIVQTVINSTNVNNLLAISSLTVNHEGNYTCIGSNTLPNGTVSHSRSLSISVEVLAVSFTGMALNATAVYLSWDIPGPLGNIISHYVVECDELETDHDWSFSVMETNASITSLHPYYSYSCRVQIVGSKTYPFNSPITVITDQAAPTAAPQNLSIVVFDDDSISVNLTWCPPPPEDQNGVVLYYIVQMNELETSIMFEFISNSTSISLDSLHAYYSYTFQVAAVTISKGPFSDGLTVLMPEDSPSSPPLNLSADIEGPNSVVIGWVPPPFQDQNGKIRSYAVQITEIETGVKFNETTKNTTISVKYLHPNYNYHITVSALTVITGPSSDVVIIVMPEDVPSGPPEFFDALPFLPHSAFFLFTPPPMNRQNGVIIGYVININILETNETFIFYTNDTYMIVDNLRPFRTHVCIIAAQTAVGTGKFVSGLTFTTFEDGAVGNLHSAHKNDFLVAAFTIGLGPFLPPMNKSAQESSLHSSSSLALAWNPPSTDQQNGLVIPYFISIMDHETQETFNHTTFDKTFTFDDLLPFRRYSCIVATETRYGLGPYTVSLKTTSPKDAPNVVPAIITSYAVDSSTVAIHWNPPPDQDNGIIRKYRVFMHNINSGENRIVVYTTATATIHSLIPSFSYLFLISAITVEEGLYSTVINITMPEDVPSGFPKALSGNSSSPNGIFLTWSPPAKDKQNGHIIRYVVNVTHADTLGTKQYFTTMTHIYISGLDPYTTYVCVVAAQTSIGVGPFSHVYLIQTQEDAPEGAPLHASGIALGPTSIHITWDPPAVEDHNGIIREYRVNVTQSDSQYLTQETTNQTQIVIDNLKPYTVYHCYVVAVTVDEGPYTDAISVITDEAAPSAPPQSISVDVLDSSTIVISWSPPPLSKRNGIIQKYSIEIFKNKSKKLTFTTGSTSFNTSTLKPYTTYSIHVAAVTIDTGPYSEIYNATTFQDAPKSPPIHVSGVSYGPTSIHISWDPPSVEDRNGVIRGYHVNVTQLESEYYTQKTTNQTQININNLKPNTVYHCYVAAITVDEGPYSDGVVVITDEIATRDSPLTGELETSTIGIFVGLAAFVMIVIFIFLLAVICVVKNKFVRKKRVPTRELPNVTVRNQVYSIIENDYDTVNLAGDDSEESTDLLKKDNNEENEEGESEDDNDSI